MRQCQSRRKCGDRGWACGFHPSADGCESPLFTIHDTGAFRRYPEVTAAALDDFCAAHLHQLSKKCGPFRHRRQDDKCQQRVMQFIRITDDRPRLTEYFLDRCRIECANVAGIHSQCSPHLNGTSPSLFERRIIEVCVWIRIQDFMRQG